MHRQHSTARQNTKKKYLCRVVMWKWCLMWKCYFILLPKPSCSCAFFGFDIYPYILFHLKKCFYYSCIKSIC